MKLTRIFSIFVLGSLSVLSWSCQNDDNFLEFENPIPLKTEVLRGIWKARQVVQFDKEALDNGFPEDIQYKDITALFPFDEYQIEFSLDAEGRPAAFTITPGGAPNFLNILSGIWELDDLVFTKSISLSNPIEFSASTLRVEVLAEDVIKLHIVRSDLNDNTEYSYYQYVFVKQ